MKMNVEIMIDDEFIEKYGEEISNRYFLCHDDIFTALEKLAKYLSNDRGLSWHEFSVLWEDTDSYIEVQGDDLSKDEVDEKIKRRELIRSLVK